MKFSPQRFCPLLLVLALLACADPDNDSPPSPPPAPPSPPTPSAFSVALAIKVDPTTTDILPFGSSAAANQVVGLPIAENAVKSAKSVDPSIEGVTLQEVWLTDTTYFNADGTAKEAAAGKAWRVVWDAFDPTDPTTSVKGASMNSKKVYISDSKTGTKADKPGRRTVQVGATLLDKTGGAVVVVSIYQPDTTGTALTGRVAQYQLTITQAPDPTDPTDWTNPPPADLLTIVGQHGDPADPDKATAGNHQARGGTLTYVDDIEVTLKQATGASTPSPGQGIVWHHLGLAGSKASAYELTITDAVSYKDTVTVWKDHQATVTYNSAPSGGLKGSIYHSPYGQKAWPVTIKLANDNS